MNYSKLGLLSVVFSSLLISCTYNDIAPPRKDVDIYVTGTISYTNVAYDSNISIATYWKNGVLTKLSEPPIQTTANAITVSGSDVYIAGESGVLSTVIDGKTIPPPLKPMATYWKNGVMNQLSNEESYARAIAVSGSDVYVAGQNSSQAAVWKNGVLTKLPDFGSFSTATAIALVGSDVYAAGFFSTLTETAVYWKNGVLVQLSDSPYARATGITISGGDVYVSGQNDTTAVYWKNGVIVPLHPTQPSIASGIAVLGSDVYTAGSILTVDGMVAAYWKNGQLTQLSDRPLARILSISIAGTDIYMAGKGDLGAEYWKNDAGVYLAHTLVGPLEATGIFVK
jgi:hypothetical protein